jgi:hypothetical protein
VALQDLDSKSVWVFDEKESRHQGAFAIKLLDRVDLDACSRHARMFGVEIVDREGDVPVSRAQFVGLLATVVDRQLQFEGRFRVAEID